MATKKTTKATKTTKTTKAANVAPAKKSTTTKKKSILGPIIGAIVAAITIIGIVIGVALLVDNINKGHRAGKYELISLYINDQEENSVDLLKALGLSASLELREDGTCTVDIFGQSRECTYNDTAFHMIDSDTDTPYTYADKEITFEDGGNSMTFSRVEE